MLIMGIFFIQKGDRPPLIEGCPKPIEDLMTSCWDPSPEKRPSMEYVVEIMRTLCQFFSNADEPLDYNKIDVVSILEMVLISLISLELNVVFFIEL